MPRPRKLLRTVRPVCPSSWAELTQMCQLPAGNVTVARTVSRTHPPPLPRLPLRHYRPNS
jgi:hypothetical protein